MKRLSDAFGANIPVSGCDRIPYSYAFLSVHTYCPRNKDVLWGNAFWHCDIEAIFLSSRPELQVLGDLGLRSYELCTDGLGINLLVCLLLDADRQICGSPETSLVLHGKIHSRSYFSHLSTTSNRWAVLQPCPRIWLEDVRRSTCHPS